MDFKSLIIISLITVGFAEEDLNDTVLVPPEEYVVSLQFYLREDKIPGIVNYMLNNSLLERNIDVRDIIQLTGLANYNLDDAINLCKKFDIPESKAFSVSSLELVLNSLSIKFSDFYQTITTKLQLKQSVANQAIADLTIPPIDFLSAILYYDSYVYDVLRAGNYDNEHVTKALERINKSKEELFQAFKNVILEQTLGLNSTYFMQALKNNGLNRNSALKLWTALGITTEDVYRVEKFRNILNDIVEDLNQNLTIGVVVGQAKVAIHQALYDRLTRHVDANTIKILTDKSAEVMVSHNARRLGPNVLELDLISSNGKHSYVEITEDYELDFQCIYITIVDGEIITEEMDLETRVLARKTNSTVFNVGSPLVCGGRLYGLAKSENEEVLVFDTFYTKEDMPLGGSTSGASSQNELLFFTIFLIFQTVFNLL